MTVPVYVIHWNAPRWCEETVRALLASLDVDIEVIVIDNHSDRLPTLPDSVRLVNLAVNVGYSGGANHALALFRDRSDDLPYVVIACHDVRVAPDALSLCVAAAAQSPEFGILGLNGEPLGERPVEQVEWVSGTFLFLRRQCVQDVGWFDPLFRSYVEDIDLCHRARAAGWRCGLVRRAEASAHGSVDTGYAVVMNRANLTLLAAKEGDWVLAARRVLGAVVRSVTQPGALWPQTLWAALRQLTRLIARRTRGDRRWAPA